MVPGAGRESESRFAETNRRADRAQAARALQLASHVADAMRIKNLEAETNHDVKAVEYFLKERLPSIDESLPLEMMHFACTSEDINNLAYALILKEFAEDQLIPKIDGAQWSHRGNGAPLSRSADARAHPWPRRLDHHGRQGDGDFRGPRVNGN